LLELSTARRPAMTLLFGADLACSTVQNFRMCWD
jgi:hypothetical protein